MGQGGAEGDAVHLLRLNFKTPESHSTQWVAGQLHTKSSRSKSKALTYLLSFFSGGDFLSQPWKMISPPLMLVAVCRFLSLCRRLVHDGSWKLSVQSAVGVRLSLVQSFPPIW